MSLLRGAQSAVFHFLSCAPCMGVAHRRRRVREARRDRKFKETLMAERPDHYFHPDPSGTNPYWDEEITLGPGPPARRGGGHKTGTSGISRVGTQSTMASSTAGNSTDDVKRVDSQRSSDEHRDRKYNGSGNGHKYSDDDDSWNRRRYQREDEFLWGHDSAPLAPLARVRLGGSGTLSRPGTGSSSVSSYYSARAPPVNDLHPPVVSLPSAKAADNAWMLQPPPPAAVMNGVRRAVGADRSRSGSRSSSIAARGLRRPRKPSSLSLATSSSPTEYSSISTTTPSGGDDASSPPPPDTPTRTHPVRASTLPAGQQRPRPRRSRPHLSTILSSLSSPDTEATPRSLLSPASDENTAPTTPPSTARSPASYKSSGDGDRNPVHYYQKNNGGNVDDDRTHETRISADSPSLTLLESIVCPRALLASRFVGAPALEARIKLPAADEAEKLALERTPRGTPSPRKGGVDEDWAEAKARYVEAKRRWSLDI